MSTAEQDQRAAETKKANELSVLVLEYIADNPHRVQITALISAYIQTALANPCCTEGCLVQLGKAALLLTNAIGANQAQAQGQPLH